jgi:excisionase family DNA binding protein
MWTMEKLLTPAELANALGVRVVTVYAWSKKGLLPRVVLNAGTRKECVRFRLAQIEEWLRGKEKAGN